MAVRFYLRENTKHEGHVECDGGRKFVVVYDELLDVSWPEGLLPDDVVRVTAKESFDSPTRTQGIYQHRGATARVEVKVHRAISVTYWYEATIEAGNLEDAKSIYRLIRTGLIRPEESWEGPQISRRKWRSRQQQEQRAELVQRWWDWCWLVSEVVRRWYRAVINALCRLKPRFRRGQ